SFVSALVSTLVLSVLYLLFTVLCPRKIVIMSSISYAGALADLHSFPTRRSSDLTADEKAKIEAAVKDAEEAMKSDDKEKIDARRSEEHTSELQSRFDLVCRLLLEKKNVLDDSAPVGYSLFLPAEYHLRRNWLLIS